MLGRIVWFGGGLAGPAGLWLTVVGAALAGAYALGRQDAPVPKKARTRARTPAPASVPQWRNIRYVFV